MRKGIYYLFFCLSSVLFLIFFIRVDKATAELNIQINKYKENQKILAGYTKLLDSLVHVHRSEIIIIYYDSNLIELAKSFKRGLELKGYYCKLKDIKVLGEFHLMSIEHIEITQFAPGPFTIPEEELNKLTKGEIPTVFNLYAGRLIVTSPGQSF